MNLFSASLISFRLAPPIRGPGMGERSQSQPPRLPLDSGNKFDWTERTHAEANGCYFHGGSHG